MKDQDKAKEQLINELAQMRQRVTESEASETEHKRAEEEIRQRNRELAALNAIAAVVSQSLNLDEILNAALDKVLELMRLGVGGIYLADLVRRKLDMVVHRGISEEFAREVESISVDEKILEAVTAEGKLGRFTLSVEAVPKDRAEAKRILSAMKREGLSLASGVPVLLQARGEILGLMIVASGVPRQLTEAELGLLTSIGQHIAVAIQNARLYEEAARRLARLSALREIDRAISSSLELKGRLDVLLDHLTDLPHIDGVSVMVLEPGTKELETVAVRGLSEEFVEMAEVRLRDGLPGLVAEQEEPLAITDLTEDERVVYRDLIEREELASFLGIPLLAKGELIGVLGIYSRERHRWSQEQTDFLHTLAGQAAIALENGRLYEEERRRTTQLALINGVGEKAASILDLDRLMPEVTRFIQERFNYYSVALFVLDEECREVVMQAVAGGFEHLAPGEYRQSLDEGIIGFVARTGKSWLASDASQDPYYVKGFLEEVLTKSELCIPVKLGDKVIGALDVQSIHLNDFDQSDVTAMESVADRLAIAIENARLFQEARRRLHELEALAQASAAIISTLELHPRLENILNAAMAVVPAAEKGSILLRDEATGELATQTLIGYSDPRIRSTRFLREAGYSAKAVRQGRPLLIPDARADPSICYDGEIEEIRAILSAAVVPLQVKGRIIGVMALDNASRKAAFNEDDLRLLTTFADQAAIAIENARLYEVAQQELAERKRAEKRLRLLSSAVEQSTEGIAVSDLEGNLLFVNNAFATMHGYTPEELTGKHLSIFHTPEQMPSVEAANRQMQETDQFSGEIWHVGRDGTVFPTLMNNSLLRDEAGNAIGMIGTLRDITERKRAEEGLRASEQRYRLLFERNLAGVYRTTLDGRILDCNESYARIFGYDSQEEVLALRASKFYFDAADRETFIARLREQGTLTNSEWCLRRKDDSPVWVLENSSLIEGEEGAPTFIQGTLVDITERVRAGRLLHALNKAALAIERALTPEEIFAAVAREFKKLGFACVVFLTDESQSRLFVRYSSYEAGAIKALEKLTGLKVESFSIPIETADVYRKVVWQRQTTFVENVEDVTRQFLPKPLKKFAGQIVKVLKIARSIPAPLIVEDEVIGLLSVESDDLTERDIPAITAFAHQMAAAWRKATLLQDLEQSLAEVEQAQEELQRTADTLRRTLGATIQAMAVTVETRDPYTAGHQRQVANLARAIATEMDLPKEQIEGIRMAATIHDIGKITVPTDILNKPTRLSEHEFGIVQDHPKVGYNMLKTIEFPWPIAQVILQHHERMDGSGYPQGLSGEEIILEARVLAVADVVEAIASHRPYRPARGIDEALAEISQNKGVLYDPEVVDVCLKLFTEKGFTFE